MRRRSNGHHDQSVVRVGGLDAVLVLHRGHRRVDLSRGVGISAGLTGTARGRLFD